MKRFLVVTLLVFVFPVLASSQSLVWYANSEADLAGYKLYRRSVTTGTTWQLWSDVGNVTTYPLGPQHDGYDFALTAYDTSDNESEKSTDVTYNPSPSDCSNVEVGEKDVQ